MAERGDWGTTLETKSPTLFLIGGTLLVVYGILNGMETFLDIGYPFVSDVIVGPAGFFLGFIRLLGIYPSVARQNPKLAKIGALFASLGAVGWLLAGVRRLTEHTGGGPPGWLEMLGLLIPVGFGLGFLIFSIASARSEAMSLPVAIVLLIPLLGVGVNIGVKAVGISIPVARVIVNLWFAGAYLAIGAALRSAATSIGRTGPTTGATT